MRDQRLYWVLILPAGSCRTPIAGYCHKVDGKLEFRGLIASLDGKTILETSRTGAWGAADAVAAGKDAGDYLKTLAPKEFFESLVENGVSW